MPLVGVRALHPAGTVLVAPVAGAVAVVAIACFDSILVPVVGVGVGVGVEAGGEAGHVRGQVQFCEEQRKEYGRFFGIEAPFANGLPYFAAIRSRKSTFGTGLFTLFGALDVQQSQESMHGVFLSFWGGRRWGSARAEGELVF